MNAVTSNFSVLLENNLVTQKQATTYFYENPTKLITVYSPAELEQGFASIEKAVTEGFHVAGWMSYEAGLCLEQKLLELVPEKLDFPLLKMGVFNDRHVLAAEDTERYWNEFENSESFSLNNFALKQNRQDYDQALAKIKNYLEAGDIYQVNYTQKAGFDVKGSSKAFYAALRVAQPVEYAAYIESDDLQILSLSPELLIKKVDEELTVKPMKGTCKRGRTLAEDTQQSEKLLATEKERAENLMIVDLLRNDLSRLAKNGTVKVEKLFEVEKYRTLFAMTSTIKAKIDKNKSIIDIIKAVFPCGSVTGAPKIRAQQIINELENQQRGIYTGAIGYFTPSGDMCLNVPIRTISIDSKGRGELGIGGGIVADSNVDNEYEESLLKAQFVTKNHPKFELVESIFWSLDNNFNYLDLHLKRLQNSANYFNFEFNKENIIQSLKNHTDLLDPTHAQKYKIRLLLDINGKINISSETINPNNHNGTVVLSSTNTNSDNLFFFHKTTIRDFYEQELQKHEKESACFDVIFTNQRGELTEGSRTNLFIKKNGVLYTPPIECGLLAGIFRQRLLDDESIHTVEKILFAEDLYSADQLYLCNSIRGMVAVNLV